ncbi:MAG: hypothetical protein C7B44_13395 [Sulfobacillus thermosulfidooxidans]|uniref:DUF1707 domain-containing protein n=1 Tax=Sulfobacillus thermotolerans TaxID=338644 RepID=A0ABM6RNG3_9FIRM|nr:hypothetical protein [Sulfobacillus sp. hq2]AUW92922.1 hypothetical protein BXT84_02330 [Sulfobacillus thermotolerans]MCY0907156.1 hypothetical protein [Sulfobacillus thermotolerans]POB11215.1 hypothetical protein CO251_06645 [Sulfobacillus sp. hq2]PSR35598.1 MAG: hypothetical protein C7B44_13395 [Sulfobacillus thermosulfidooxidans]
MPLSTDDLRTFLHSARALGPEYDEEWIEQVRTAMQRADIDAGLSTFAQLSPAQQRRWLRQARRIAQRPHPWALVAVVFATMAFSIPLLAIGGMFGQLPGILAVLSLDVLAMATLWWVSR